MGTKQQLLPPPDDLRAEIEQSRSLGFVLYQHDLASAIGTDVMRANVPAPKELGIAGYLTHRDADDDGRVLDTWHVMFFSAGDSPHEICSVRVPMQDGATPVFTLSKPQTPVSDFERSLIRARQTALAAIMPVSQPQNPVILLGLSGGKPCIVVYMLAGTTRNDVVVLGQHHRVLVSLSGETVVSVQPLSKSIIEVPLKSEVPPDLGPGWVDGPLFVTHLVTAWPLETHVFASLLHRIPIVVGTSRGNWMVEGTQISLVPLPPPSSDPAPSTSKSPPPAPAPAPSASKSLPPAPAPAPSTSESPTPPARPALKASDTPPIAPTPRFNAILSRKPWWRFW